VNLRTQYALAIRTVGKRFLVCSETNWQTTAVAFRAMQGLDDYARFLFETCADHPEFSKLHRKAKAKALPQCSFSGCFPETRLGDTRINALHGRRGRELSLNV
jgi:hypothetical protein